MPAQDNREPEALSLGSIIEELKGARDRIFLGVKRAATGLGPLQPPGVSTGSCLAGSGFSLSLAWAPAGQARLYVMERPA